MLYFERLSISPGCSIDPETGEVLETLEENDTTGVIRPGSYSPPIYPQESIDLARKVTSDLCESILSRCTGGKRAKRGNNKGYDIILPNGLALEAKMGRIGNSAVIKENQLFDFDSDFWGFMFYRTVSNLPPSYYTSIENNRSPKENLLRNLSIDSIFIFPTRVIKYYWNTTPVKKGKISTTGINHRPLSLLRAYKLLSDLNNIPGIRYLGKKNVGQYIIPIRTIDLDL